MKPRTTDSPELALKKLTLTAWTHILYQQGRIDLAKANRMETLIRRLPESGICRSAQPLEKSGTP